MAGRIETQIVSRVTRRFRWGAEQGAFREDEAMEVEYSCKYSLEDFAALAAKAGLAVMRVWTDPKQMFSVQYLVRCERRGALNRQRPPRRHPPTKKGGPLARPAPPGCGHFAP